MAAISRETLDARLGSMPVMTGDARSSAVERFKAMFGQNEPTEDEVKLYGALKYLKEQQSAASASGKMRVTAKLMNNWRVTVENSVAVYRDFFAIKKSDKARLDEVEELKGYMTPWSELRKVPGAYKESTHWILGSTCPTGQLGRIVERISLSVAVKQTADAIGADSITPLDDWVQDNALNLPASATLARSNGTGSTRVSQAHSGARGWEEPQAPGPI